MGLFGWKPDVPDFRDKVAALPVLKFTQLPKSMDLRLKCPPIYDQKTLGSCTANSVGALFQFTEMEQRGKATGIPSRLFLYYNTRSIEGTVKTDSGASIRDTIKALNKNGVCREVDWPYDITKFKVKPGSRLYDQARVKRVSEYSRVPQTIFDIKSQLTANNPIAFGFSVYESFMSNAVAKTGICPLPLKSESLEGGHAVLLVGYDDDKQAFLVRNSWGPKWGIKGCYWMPYDYVLNKDLADDFWTVVGVP